MLFNSLQFVLFFIAVVILYFSVPSRFRWIILLSASYYFYGCWKPGYLLIIIANTLISYFACIKISSTNNKRHRKIYFILTLCACLFILIFFKYFSFLNDNIALILKQFNIFYRAPTFNILLPIGISFYTFQNIGYVIDVYKNHKKPEFHYGIFSLYISFFPQLVAGPIERSNRLLPQLKKNHVFEYCRLTDGMKLMLWGFFKKLVIADRLAIYVNTVYNNPQSFYGIPIILATYFFAFQIYCDFSGYSDIARGTSKILGYELMVNFNKPYFAKSLRDFWSRWHISLSSWFRDYLYIPLGGNRVSKSHLFWNLSIVFLISGFWHGAEWTFVVWGAIHGFYYIFGLCTKNFREGIENRFFKLLQKNSLVELKYFVICKKFLQIIITFHLVVFAWIFFRANSISDALVLLKNAVQLDLSLSGIGLALGKEQLIVAFASIFIMESIHFFQNKHNIRLLLIKAPFWLRWSIYYVSSMIILIWGEFGANEFIYFQF